MNYLAKILPWSDTPGKFVPYAAIPLRLIVGYGLMEHGVAKLLRGPEVFVTILRAIGVPLPEFMAWLTIATGAAARLGLKRTTLYQKMKKLGIGRPLDEKQIIRPAED